MKCYFSNWDVLHCWILFQMDIIHTLLKACYSMENYETKVRETFFLLCEFSSFHKSWLQLSSWTLRTLKWTSLRSNELECGPMIFLQCKKMVFEYAPLLIANTAQFLETHDICITVHACNAPAFTLGKRLPDMEISSLSYSWKMKI